MCTLGNKKFKIIVFFPHKTLICCDEPCALYFYCITYLWERFGAFKNTTVIHHLIMIWQMLLPLDSGRLAPFQFTALSNCHAHSPGINSCCLSFEPAGAPRAAGAWHCQWTQQLTLPQEPHKFPTPTSHCFCFNLYYQKNYCHSHMYTYQE